MDSPVQLLDEWISLTAAIKEAEPWEKVYTDTPEILKQLTTAEAKLEAAANLYLVGLAERVESIVDWSQVKLQAAAVPSENDETFKAETRLLYGDTHELLLTITVLGAQSGEVLYSSPIGVSPLMQSVLDAAGTQTAALVTQVTSTTRKYIQTSIEQAIRQGLDRDQTVELIRKRISNPVRAEMIASTESVNAFQSGLDAFAVETGAKSSTWESLIGACKLCAPLNGVTRPIGKPFKLGNGREVMRPAAHVKCRCGRRLNY